MAGPKTQKEIAMKKGEKKTKEKRSEDKQNKPPRQTAIAFDQSMESTSTSETLNKDVHASSTPKTKQKAKLKTIDVQTRPEDILDTFQNRNLAPAEWENLVDQLLKRGSKTSRTISKGISNQHLKGTQYLSLLKGFWMIPAPKIPV